jgi:hypothetical protein
VWNSRNDGADLRIVARALASRRILVCALVCSVTIARVADAEPSEVDPTVGYNYQEIETPRIAGTGGATRASSNSTHALFINPANLSRSRVYHLTGFAQVWPEASRQSYGVAAVDSIVSSSRVAGGVGAVWNFQDADGIDRKSTDLRFALSYPLSDSFFVGLGGRYLWLSQDGEGPLGPSLASSGLRDSKILRGIGFDAGVTLRASEHFSLSAVGTNLNGPDEGLMPTTAGGGLAVSVADFVIEADGVFDFTTYEEVEPRLMLGAEALFADHVAARVGYRFDLGADSHAIAGGVGYVNREFDVDVSVRRVVAGEAVTAVVIGFSYHIEATGLTPSPADSF